jgi:predicted porin
LRRHLLTVAVLGTLAHGAQAQSSVTVYGSFDGGLRHLTNVNAAGESRLSVNSKGTYKSNHLGFRGTEDLGGGMNAHFVLESGFETGTGALDNTTGILFRRQAYVGIGSTWGALDIGRQYTVAFRVAGTYEPFEYKYTDIVPVAGAATGARFNNDIQYTGKFGPVTVRAEYALGENAGSVSNGSAQGLGMVYAAGPVVLGGAYTKRKLNIATAAPVFGDNANWTLGGGYRFGPMRVTVGYINEEQETTAVDRTTKNAWAGLQYDMTSQIELTGAFYQTKTSAGGLPGKRNLAMLGSTYALSKRTNLYAEIDRSKLSGLAISNGQTSQTGISVGMNHYF